VIGLRALLEAVATQLAANGTKWAVVGGLAVSARTAPRFTQDIDLAVAVPDDATAEALVSGLTRGGFHITALVEQTATGRLATARLSKSGSGLDDALVDLLFASSGIEAEVVAGADPVELFPHLVAPIAKVGHLIAMKVLARDDESRPQDLIDLRALLSAANDSDLATAREGLTLISERGYHRDRELQADLDTLLARFRPDK
jgi:nucleotidyltransferase AbiEii toxin of type IV toxin-antitoxin system